jgi:hypothetical protein
MSTFYEDSKLFDVIQNNPWTMKRVTKLIKACAENPSANMFFKDGLMDMELIFRLVKGNTLRSFQNIF